MKQTEQEQEQPLILPEPAVVALIRPILVEAMTESEPGTPNFELAAYLHDEMEEFLTNQKVTSDGDRY